jgi:hypothetical protein
MSGYSFIYIPYGLFNWQSSSARAKTPRPPEEDKQSGKEKVFV